MARNRHPLADRALVRLLTARRRCGTIARAESGVAALEFALLAPILFFGLMATADLGLALHERMTMDHILRTGAQVATADPGAQAVQEALERVAKKNFTVVATAEELEADPAAVLPSAGQPFHACRANPDTEVSSSTICTDGKPTSIYYRLTAEKFYDGMMLPRMHLKPSIVVQIR